MEEKQTRHGALRLFLRGARDGMPICLGYLAVSFSLGITAGSIGLTAFQGFLASLLNAASAGEYAGFERIAENASYLAMALTTLVVNARYLLMSAALSQRFDPDTPFYHRLLIGFYVTDELFGLAIAQPDHVKPAVQYGAITVSVLGWSVGTAVGIAAGSVLPPRVVSALSVALYGMFLAIIIPPARRNRVVAALVLISFGASFAFSAMKVFASDGTKTLVLTVAISALAAALFPVKDASEGGAADGA